MTHRIDRLKDGLVHQATWDTMLDDASPYKKRLQKERTRARRSMKMWTDALHLLEQSHLVARHITHESFAAAMAEIQEDEQFGIESSFYSDAAPDILIRLFLLRSLASISCITCQEVYELLRQGFIAGAASRVRNMFESLVVATLVFNESSGSLAVRYHDLASVRAYQEELARSQWDAAPNYYAVNQKELHGLRQIADDIKGRWEWTGNVHDNEWARPYVELKCKPTPKGPLHFKQLEKAAELSKDHSLYQLLSESVHVSPLHVVRHFHFGAPLGQEFPFSPHIGEDELLAKVPEVIVAAARITSDHATLMAKIRKDHADGAEMIHTAETLSGLVNVIELKVQNVFEQVADWRKEAGDL
jgi:hypothetical protein